MGGLYHKCLGGGVGVLTHMVVLPRGLLLCDPALSEWGVWCRRPLRYLHQSSLYDDVLVGEGFLWPSCGVWNGCPAFFFMLPASSNHSRMLPWCSARPGSRSVSNPSRCRGGISLHRVLLTIDDAQTVYLLRTCHWILHKSPYRSSAARWSWRPQRPQGPFTLM